MPHGHWLVKSEPSRYAWQRFAAEGKACWDGVRNHEARNHLAAMKRADLVLFYHSTDGKQVVGVARVVREAYPDPSAEDPRWLAVDLEPVAPLAIPVALQQIKADHPECRSLVLVYNLQEQAQAEAAARLLERWASGTVVDSTARPLTIGRAARLLGVTADALRTWERNGLARIPRDPHSGYRQYGSAEAFMRMVRSGYQALDLAAEGRSLTLAEIEQIHVLKTGALIRASVVMAAHCAPSLDPARLQSLTDFGSTVGIAFQIQDDLLDVEGDVALIGKATGSDEARAMPTYPAVAGLESARARVRELHRRAADSLETHGWGAGPLAALADWLLTRRH